MVVGGTGNVGRHLVQAQLAAGVRVVVPSRDPHRLAALEQFLPPDHAGQFVPAVGDMAEERAAARLLHEVGPLDGAVASLGGFVQAPSVLDAPRSDLERTLEGYLFAHFAVARAIVPHLRERGGGYLMINGPLAFDPLFPGAGLVSIATAAQAMLARVLMNENSETPVRINELVIYSSFGWGEDEHSAVTGEDLGRYVAHLLSPDGEGVRERTIHLRSPEAFEMS
jgi:NAD(P)-dependent dehydrogenase (short-subunit alcohol dehydrogenase family)